MKDNIAKLIVIATVSFGAAMCFAENAPYSPIANLTERWTNDPAWTVWRGGTPSIIDESMAVSFMTDLPNPVSGSAKADGLSSGGRFVGNYVASGIDFVSFDVMRVGLDSIAQVQFVGKSGVLWYRNFSLPEEQGVWENREIPVTTADGWKCTDKANALSFDEEKTDIKSMEVCALTSGSGTQQIRVDNFKVVGPWELGPLTDDEMPLYWLLENGFAVQGGLAILDKDGDGFSNYAEYLAGTDPNDANSKFVVNIERGEDGSLALSWQRENYRSYRVLKSTDLVSSGSFMEENGSIQALGARNRMAVNGSADAFGFYRVQIEK